MADLRIQRNLAIAIAGVALAAALGFALHGHDAGSVPEVGLPSAVPQTAAVDEEKLAPAVPAVPEPAAERASRNEAASAGTRWGVASPRPETAAPAPVVETAREAASEAEVPSEVDVRAARTVTVPDGTPIELVLTAPVSSQSAQVGDLVQAELAQPVVVDGDVALPTGARVVGRVSEVQALRKIGGRARLALAFESVELDGGEVPIAAYWAREGRSETGKDAATIAGGAVLGTILGNQAKKNDRGKVIGGVVGAAAGTAVAAKTRGEHIDLAAGAELHLTLREAVIVAR